MSFLGILSFQRSQHNPLFPSFVTVETTWFLLCFAWRYTRSYYHSCSVTWENSTTHRYSWVHFLRGWVCLQAVYQADLCNTTEKEEHRCEDKSSWVNICCSLEHCCVRACKTGNSRCTLWQTTITIVLRTRSHQFGCFCKFHERLTVSHDRSSTETIPSAPAMSRAICSFITEMSAKLFYPWTQNSWMIYEKKKPSVTALIWNPTWKCIGCQTCLSFMNRPWSLRLTLKNWGWSRRQLIV